MKILQATQKDLDAIVELNQQLDLGFPDYKWNTSNWIKEEIDYGSFYILKNRNKILGAICLQTVVDDPTEAYIETLAIHHDKHQRGYGRTLINFAKTKAKESSKSLLTVGSFTNYRAKDFYLKCGFTEEKPMQFWKGMYPFYWFYMKI